MGKDRAMERRYRFRFLERPDRGERGFVSSEYERPLDGPPVADRFRFRQCDDQYRADP